MIANAAVLVFGMVIGVHDADTITVLTTDNVKMHVRIAYIDAPELGQDFGKECKDKLLTLSKGRFAAVDVVQPADRYGRVVGEVQVEHTDAGTEMVRIGCAWVYRQYAPADSPLIAVEKEAAKDRIGLWSAPMDKIIPPWLYRKYH